MNYLFALLILIFCAPAVFLPSSRLPVIYWTAGLAAAIGAFGLTWSRLISPEFLAAHPAIATSALNPEVAQFFGGVCFLFSVGLLLALAARYVMVRTKVLKPRP